MFFLPSPSAGNGRRAVAGGVAEPELLLEDDGLESARAFRSKPAQKVSFAPWKMATFWLASFSNAINASASFRAVGGLTALRLDGRERVIVVMPSGVV